MAAAARLCRLLWSTGGRRLPRPNSQALGKNVCHSSQRLLAVPSNKTSLDSLIMQLVEEADDISDIAAANSIGALKKIYATQRGSITGDVSVKILSRCAALARGNNCAFEGAEWLKSGPMSSLDDSLENASLSIHSVLNALSALISLDLMHEPVYNRLIDLLALQFRSSSPSVTISPIVQFIALVNNKKIRLPEDLYKKIIELLKMKANEITSPEDIVSIMLCWNKNDIWFSSFIEKAKGSISAMTSGELVGMVASLAKNSCRPVHILRLISTAFDQKKEGLTLNQVITLAQSTAKLNFVDGRVQQVLADETFANISRFAKWSQINSVVESLVKLRVGDLRAWKALAAWINNNHMNAGLLELSFALHWCAIIGVGDLVKEALNYLGQKLDTVSDVSPRTWLSAVYTLALCDCLTPDLAKSVLEQKFISVALERLNTWQKLMMLTNIAQIQALLKTNIEKGYQGPVVTINSHMKMSQTALNEMAMKLRYGKSDVASVQHFHSLFYKLAPMNTHAMSPALNEDGVFVNAVVKLDVRANHFVPLDQFDDVQVPRLAVLFLSWKDRTLTCNDEDESRMMGPITLNIRLLKDRGLIPVIFSQEDFDSNTTVKQQFELIKEKLEAASMGSVSH